MRTFLTLLTSFVLLAASAPAQVYALEFAEEKFQKPFKKQIYNWNGKAVLLVEVGPDMSFGPDGEPTWEPEQRVTFFVQDQGDPTEIGYSLDEEGSRETRKKALLVAISSERLGGITEFLPQESFLTLAAVAERELAHIDALEDAIKDAKREPERQDALQKELLQTLKDYRFWLQRTGYLEAAEDLDRPLKKLYRALGPQAGKVEEAGYKVVSVKASPELVAAGHRVGGNRLNFHVRESAHLRIVYHTGITDSAVEQMLQLGERVIEEFQTRTLVPAAQATSADPLGGGIILELFLGTKQRPHQEKMLGEYYGLEWGEYMGDAGKGRSRGNHFALPDRELSYWRVDERIDIQGVLLHRLGHVLARRAYGVLKDKQDWIEEGLGYHLSMRYLGHANGSCIVFPVPERSFASKVITEGLEKRIARVALEDGPRLENLFGLQLYTYETQQVAKAWALISWLDTATGPAGHTWLRELTPTLQKSNYVQAWHKRTTELFGLGKGNPIQLLELECEAWMKDRYGLK